MEKRDLEELLALEKKLYGKLTETTSLTKELGEAVERQDQASVRLLLSQRQKSVLELQELQAYIGLKRCDLSGDGERFDALTAGLPALDAAERPVEAQVALNRRLLEQLVALDKRINLRLCGRRSCYGG